MNVQTSRLHVSSPGRYSCLAAAAVSALLAVAACSSNDNTMSMADNDAMLPAPLEIPATISVSSREATYAQTAADTVESMTGTAFSPISTGWVRSFVGTNSVSLQTGDRVQTNAITIDDEGGITVEGVVEGEPKSVSFTAEQLVGGDYVTLETHVFTAWEYNLTDANDEPLDQTYYRLGTWEVWPNVPDDEYDWDEAHVAAFGARTMPDNLPVGTASYAGIMTGSMWDSNADGNIKYAVAHRNIWGVLALEADLDASTISGNINTIWVRSSSEDGREWAAWPETTGLSFSDGRIVDGQFAASWTGSETDSAALDATSLREFEGDLFGGFYGPAGEEAAGVINGQRSATDTTPDQLFVGVFGAEVQ